MDKVMEMETLITHNISISERKNIIISGVKRIESFDNEEFLIESLVGYLLIKGIDLEIIKLDTIKGNISIKGKINSLTYVDEDSKAKENTVISRLFK